MYNTNKRIIIFVIIFLTFFTVLTSCGKNEKESTFLTSSDLKTKEQRSSYTFGTDLAKNLTDNEEFRMEAFIQGFRDQAQDRPLLLSDEEMIKIRSEGKEIVQKTKQQKENWIKPDNNLILSDKFLHDNRNKEGIEETPSGLQYKVIKKGDGPYPKNGDKVKVHYIGTLRRGEEFDNSYKNGNPVEVTLGKDNVIKGWQEGLKLMPEGSKYMLYIPPKLAYGEEGRGIISPNSVLIFEIELLEIIN